MSAERITAWREWRLAAGIRPATIVVQGNIINRLADAHDLDTVTGDQVAGWIAGHGNWGPDHRKTARSALRSYFKWATATGKRDTDPTVDLQPVRVPPPSPKPVPEDALVAALRISDDRVRLMVLLAAFAGLRRAEIASLRREDLEGDLLWICGKGGKTRVVPVFGELLERLQDSPTGYLFPGRFPDTPTCPDHIGRALSEVLPAGYSGHKLRHRYASRIYSATRDLLSLQELLGHASPETTRRYVQTDMDALRRATATAALAGGAMP